jgi:hypothetical protein
MNITLNHNIRLLIVSLSLLTAVTSAPAALMIDDYSTSTSVGGGITLSPTGYITSFESNPAGAIGDRTTTIIRSGGSSHTETYICNGSFVVSGWNDLAVEIVYDVTDVDLSADGEKFSFEMTFSDLDDRNPSVSHPYEITLTSGSVSESASVMVSAEDTYEIPFSQYTSVDLTSVDEIKVTVDTQGIFGTDDVFGPLSVVPEPATVVLLMLGGIGAAIRRRKTV